MIKNVWSDNKILQSIIQQEVKNLTNILLENLILKTENFKIKIRI